jgi:hypothetical protein
MDIHKTSLDIHKHKTSPLHPQSDGMVERFNRTLCNSLAMYVEDHQRDWDSHLLLVMMAYRSSIHDATQYSQSYLLFGRELRLPVEVICGGLPEISEEPVEYAAKLERLSSVHRFVRQNLSLAADAMKHRHDGTDRVEKISVDDLVWLLDPWMKKGLSPKLQSNWTGPFTVEEVINDQLCRVRVGRKSKLFHRSRL